MDKRLSGCHGVRIAFPKPLSHGQATLVTCWDYSQWLPTTFSLREPPLSFSCITCSETSNPRKCPQRNKEVSISFCLTLLSDISLGSNSRIPQYQPIPAKWGLSPPWLVAMVISKQISTLCQQQLQRQKCLPCIQTLYQWG